MYLQNLGFDVDPYSRQAVHFRGHHSGYASRRIPSGKSHVRRGARGENSVIAESRSPDDPMSLLAEPSSVNTVDDRVLSRY
jgi:hypothetical protein